MSTSIKSQTRLIMLETYLQIQSQGLQTTFEDRNGVNFTTAIISQSDQDLPATIGQSDTMVMAVNSLRFLWIQSESKQKIAIICKAFRCFILCVEVLAPDSDLQPLKDYSRNMKGECSKLFPSFYLQTSKATSWSPTTQFFLYLHSNKKQTWSTVSKTSRSKKCVPNV